MQETRETRTEKRAKTFGKPIIRISRERLVNLLLEEEKRGANFIQLFSRTTPAMRKTGNSFFGQVEKVAETNCQINWFYDNAVNNQREREKIFFEFTPQPRTWGNHIFNPFIGRNSKTIIEHTNKKEQYNQYVQMRTLSVQEVHYEWIENGQALTETETEQLKSFMPERKKSQTQNTEKEIRVNDYKVESIEMMSMNNVSYVIH